MPWHGEGERFTVIHFATALQMPALIHQAILATDGTTQTRYIQEAICTRLAKDLGMDKAELLAMLPPGRGKRLFNGKYKNAQFPGSANTHEDVV